MSPDAIVPDADGTALAIRRLGAELVSDLGFQRRFPAEVNALRYLDEPWLAAPTSYLLDGAGRVVAALRRHVPGLRLSSFLDQHPRGVDAQTTTVVAIDVLAALSALHARGVGHRAVTAENIVIDTDGTCVLVDVGLSPRTAPETLETMVSTDLTWFADLIARCLAGGPVGRRRRQAPLLMGDSLPKTVPEPVRTLLRRTLDPARGAASVSAAAVALADLSVSAVQMFDADWDVRARERLAKAARAVAQVDARPRSAGPSADRRRRLTGHRAGHRVHPASLAFGILGIGAGIGISVAVTSITGGPPAMTQIMMYTTPTDSAPGASHSPTTRAPGTAAATTSPTAVSVTATTPGGGSPGQTSPTPSSPEPSLSATSVTAPPAGSPSPASPGTGTAAARTSVTGLSIAKFAYTRIVPVEAVVVVKVHASDTGPVDMTLTFAGSNQLGVAGTNSQLSVTYTLHGKREYLLSYRVFSIDYCYTDFWGVTVTTSPEAPSSAFAQLPSLLCWGPHAKSTPTP